MVSPDDYIGKTVAAKYRVEQLIGEGGMGKVYRATQLSLDKRVGLKVLRKALLSDQRTVARFQREAKAASRLNHPNSISVLDFGQLDDGALYIAMELVHGRDLHEILVREWPLPESRIIRIMSQVLSALTDAHSASVIHRDLKPENIMVEQRRGQPDFVKVLDFGIAKIVADEGPALTRAGFVCGTPEYMSPEQARGAVVDYRSDLYAVGVILYQLVSGLLPFDSDSPVGFATAHLTQQPPLLSRRRPEAKVGPELQRLIMRALAKSPDDRPQTAAQFRAELLAIEENRRAQASLVRRGASFSSRRPVPRVASPLDEQKVKRPLREWGAASIFKVATVLLVALSLGPAWLNAWQIVGRRHSSFAVPPANEQPLWALELDPSDRRAPEAARLAEQGDEALFDANLDLARARYEEAWRAAPSPELALKLGEVAYRQNRLKDAGGWWRRHRRDAPGSKAKAYLDRLPLDTAEVR